MAAKNDITGDRIKTGANSQAYRDNPFWDKVSEEFKQLVEEPEPKSETEEIVECGIHGTQESCPICVAENYEAEIRNLKALLWAATKSNGGKLIIRDVDIHDFGPESILKRFNDDANHQVIFEVNTNKALDDD